ncbi:MULTISPECIES: hypothetical protein [unclassified Carboxylicivirga]|uniref:hypothetical protein n=1 Tax=Carboxylicivirga TaxID=1628153 RepID=UPI003D33EC23
MKTIASTLIIFTLALISCTEETIVPTTGNVLLIDEHNEFDNQKYYIVSEVYYLTTDDPYWFRSDNDALYTGTLTDTQTEINDLNTGIYYVVFPIERKYKVFQVKAGKTIECKL